MIFLFIPDEIHIFIILMQNEAVIFNQWDDNDHESFYILRLATVLCLHRNKYCMGNATSMLMLNEYKSIIMMKEQVQTFSSYCCSSVGGRVGELHKYRQLNRHAFLSQQFWAVFQCAISFAEGPQICFWSLAFMPSSVPYSNYRWQHKATCTNTLF